MRKTHFRLFVTIGNLVFPSRLTFTGEVRGALHAPQVGIWRSKSEDYFPACGTLVFASPDRFVAQLRFGSNPIFDIFSLFAAALKIQLISSASDLFARWFSMFKHGNLPGC